MNAWILLITLFACDFDFFGSGGSGQAKKNAKKDKDSDSTLSKGSMDDPTYRKYESNGKRDPFRSFLSIAQTDDDDGNLPKTPLQRYEIQHYKLTGIIWDIDRPRALVEDPEGIGWVMELGDYIGKKWGKVTMITDNTVVVTEEARTTDGELVRNEIPLRLRFDEGTQQ
ncbi:MAG: pilus assembly protein PilP [Myxococcota bacterium]|nr:pilus assembly protein PilP [Myxococcota bacterium]